MTHTKIGNITFMVEQNDMKNTEIEQENLMVNIRKIIANTLWTKKICSTFFFNFIVCSNYILFSY